MITQRLDSLPEPNPRRTLYGFEKLPIRKEGEKDVWLVRAVTSEAGLRSAACRWGKAHGAVIRVRKICGNFYIWRKA
jgi:hypothetical protein